MNLATLLGPNVAQAFLDAVDTNRQPKRFTGAAPTNFAQLDGISTVGSERWREVNDAERDDQRAEERRERDEAGE